MPDGHFLRVYEFIQSYIPTFIICIALTSILGFPKFTFISNLFQLFILQFMIYGAHSVTHLIKEDNPLIIFTPHIFLHHNKSIQLDRSIGLLIEGLVDFSYFFTIILFQEIFNIHIFSTSIVLFAAFLYIILHIIQYSVFGDNAHALHHTYKYCNYEPEFIDVLFASRCEPDTPYRNMNKEIPHAIVAFILAGTLKLLFTLD